MTTLYPGGIDSYDTRVDGVTDVMASDVNDLQDAMVAVQTESQLKTLFKVKNTSGATVVANDVGYIDEKGDFKTTTTANLAATWAIVVTGGANNSQIMLCTRGRLLVNYRVAGGVPSINHFLVTSTTAGEANKQETMRPEIFAVCLANGAGGTVEVLLLTGTILTPFTSGNGILRITTSSDTEFVAKIDSGGSGGLTATNVPYDTIASGDERDFLISPNDGTSLGRIIMHNTTKGNSRLVTTVDTANNKFATVSSTDDWADTNDITISSQVVVPGGYEYMDIDLSQQTEIPLLTRALAIQLTAKDSGSVGSCHTHPFETFASSKVISVNSQVATIFTYAHPTIMKLIGQKFNFAIFSSGAATADCAVAVFGYYLAVP